MNQFLIIDETEFDKFVSILPDLQKDEVYFLSLSARNKYLTAKEREFYHLGRTEMFGRQVARSKQDFKLKMNDLYCKLITRKTNNGKEIPSKCVVCYANINPSSMTKAYNLFTTEVNKEVFAALHAEQENKIANYDGMRFIDKTLMNCIQKSSSRRIFTDIDMDTKDESIFNEFIKSIEEIDYNIVETKGGFHFMIKNESMPHKFNLYHIVDQMDFKAKRLNEPKEVIVNKNRMIPIPGTMQADFLVKLIK